MKCTGAAAIGGARHRQRRDGNATAELHLMRFPVAPDTKPQPIGQGVDDGHADAMQAARHLVAVLVELAAGVKLRHHDLGGRALQLVVVLQIDRDAPAVVDDGHRIVRVDDDLDVVAEAGERLVDGVVEHLEHHVVEPGAVRRVTDVHSGALADGVEPLQHLDAARIVVFAVVRGLWCCLSHRGFRQYSPQHARRRPRGQALRVKRPSLPQRQMRIGITTYL